MLFRAIIVLLGIMMLFVDPVEVHSRKRHKQTRKKQFVAKPKKFIHQEGNFSVQFPASHGEVKGDTSAISTTFGPTQFYAFVATSSQSACMVAFYDLDLKKVREKDSLLATNSKVLLDTLQQQLIANLGGTVQRKVKIVREGLYHSRIAYFTVKGEAGRTIYFKCENVYAPPRVYQLLYQSSVKNAPDNAESKKFFQSFSLKVKQ